MTNKPRINLTLSEDEKTKLEALAEENGLSIGRFMVNTCLQKQSVSKPDTAVLIQEVINASMKYIRNQYPDGENITDTETIKLLETLRKVGEQAWEL